MYWAILQNCQVHFIMWIAKNELQATQKLFKFLGYPSIFFKSAQSFSP